MNKIVKGILIGALIGLIIGFVYGYNYFRPVCKVDMATGYPEPCMGSPINYGMIFGFTGLVVGIVIGGIVGLILRK
jgi:hypothetical protein